MLKVMEGLVYSRNICPGALDETRIVLVQPDAFAARHWPEDKDKMTAEIRAEGLERVPVMAVNWT
jgi:hypothetical protein